MFHTTDKKYRGLIFHVVKNADRLQVCIQLSKDDL